jgi:hypothetical protein
LQKRCARLILDSHSTSRSFENFQELKWLPIDQVFVIKKLVSCEKLSMVKLQNI